MRFVRESRRRWTGGLGIIVAACAPPFGFDLGHMTASVSHGPQASFVSDHRGILALGLLGMSILALALLGFAYGLRYIGEGDGAGEAASRIGFGSAIAAAVLILVQVGIGAAVVHPVAPLDANSFNDLWLLRGGIRSVESVPVALLMTCTAFAIYRLRRLPLWSMWFSALTAFVMWMESVINLLGGSSGALPATTAIWAMVLSLTILLERRTRRIAASSAITAAR
jgi:hypothetical protein